MKNTTCPMCGNRFHFCSHCDTPVGWERYFCTQICWQTCRDTAPWFCAHLGISRWLSSKLYGLLQFLVPLHYVGFSGSENCDENDTHEHYDVTYGDTQICACEHYYFHHFDEQDCKSWVTCKYCACAKFKLRNSKV